MMKLDTRLCDVYLNYRRTLGIFHQTGILFEGEYLGVSWEWLQAVATCENIFVWQHRNAGEQKGQINAGFKCKKKRRSPRKNSIFSTPSA